MRLNSFIQILNDLALEPTPWEVADILWLANFIKPSELFFPNDSNKKHKSDSLLNTTDNDNGDPTKDQIHKAGEVHLPTNISNIKGQTTRGQFINVPTGPSLPGKLDLSRALRPLKRSVLSRTDFILDEASTVNRIVNEGMWLPVMKAAKSRWLELAFVVDTGPSMTIWNHTVNEFYELLSVQGAFNNMIKWDLDTEDKEDVKLYSGTRANDKNRVAHNPLELINSSHERLIILVTDCLSLAWRCNSLIDLLVKWGSKTPMVIVQVLPQHLWVRTALGSATSGRIHFPRSLSSNSKIKLKELSDPFSEKADLVGLTIPVVTFEPQIIYQWSKNFVQGSEGWSPILILNQHWKDRNKQYVEESYTVESIEPRVLIQNFQSKASPITQKLAHLLSVTPISLPVIWLLGKTMLTELRQVHIAELFMSGLLKKTQFGVDETQFDFTDGVRVLLRERLLRSEIIEVFKLISQYILDHKGNPIDFKAFIADPSASEGLQLSEGSIPLALMTSEVVALLGSRFAQLSENLKKAVDKEKIETLEIQVATYTENAQIDGFDQKAPTILESSKSPTESFDKIESSMVVKTVEEAELFTENFERTKGLIVDQDLSSTNPKPLEENPYVKLPLETIILHCQKQTSQYLSMSSYESSSCYELWRRAIQEGDQVAWEALYVNYAGVVRNWLQRRNQLKSFEEDEIINGTFYRMIRFVKSEKFEQFSNLSSILQYLKLCCLTEVHDFMRDETKRKHDISLDANFNWEYELIEGTWTNNLRSNENPEEEVTQHVDQSPFWEELMRHLPDKADRTLIYSRFFVGMPSREILETYPTYFKDEGEVYRRLKNILWRLRNTPDLKI